MPFALLTLLTFSAIAATNPLRYMGVQLETNTPPQAYGIQFDCNLFPEVCANMCWAAYCVPSSTTYLIYDKPSSSVSRERRKTAGCYDGFKPGRNRCSQGRPGAMNGYNCDEYPFASAKADSSSGNQQENRCSRCVPSKQNSRQGAVMTKGYHDFCKKKNNTPCRFQVFFANPGAGAHCNIGAQGNCAHDPAEQCTGSINIIGQQKQPQQQQQYEYEYEAMELNQGKSYLSGTFVEGPAQFRTAQGQLLDSPYGGIIGQAVYSPRPVNQTLHDELISRLEFDEDSGEEDEDGQFSNIIENMVSDVDHIVEVTFQARLVSE